MTQDIVHKENEFWTIEFSFEYYIIKEKLFLDAKDFGHCSQEKNEFQTIEFSFELLSNSASIFVVVVIIVVTPVVIIVFVVTFITVIKKNFIHLS